MSWPVPGSGGGIQPKSEEWVVTVTDGLVTRIEHVDQATSVRHELSAEEYAGVAASYYALYYAGIRDYAQAVASGNVDAAQAYYQGMAEYFGPLGQM